MAHAYGNDRVDEYSDAIEFFHYMKLVRFLMLWREIVLRLEFYQAVNDNYELKHMLALGFLNEHPIRAEAVTFFEKNIIPCSEGFELLSGVFYFKRNDFARAIPLVQKYLDSGGHDLFAFVVLCDIATLSNDLSTLKTLFNTYSPESLEGTPEQRIHIAKVRASIGDGATALAEAYRVLVENPNVAAVALGYFSVFLMVDKVGVFDDKAVVGNDYHYRLVPSKGDAIEVTVESSAEDLLALSPEKVDFYTRQVWGQCVGFEFVQEKLQGDIVWRLEEVKHRYIQAFHEVSKSYESKFPNAGGLWAFSLEGGDFQPFLDIIQRQKDKDEAIFGEILEKHMPLEIASGISKRNIFDVYDLVRSQGGKIKTCVGTHDERLDAMRLVKSYQGKGVVLDTYTISVAAELGVLNSLKDFFGHVMVSHDTVQKLQVMAADKAVFPFGKDAGYTDILGVIEGIQSVCEVVVYDFPRSSDDLTEKLIELNFGAIAPYFIAKERGALFVSEDAFSREFCAHIYKVADGAWLQVVINILAEHGLIQGEHYARSILGLAERKHSFVAVGSALLENAYRKDTNGDLSELSILCEFIGGPSAEIESHYQVILQFIISRWLLDYNSTCDMALQYMLLISHGDAFPSAKAMKATSLLLDRLIEIPGGRDKLKELCGLPVFRLKEFIIGWWKGRFYM
jgi:hypothetical protein